MTGPERPSERGAALATRRRPSRLPLTGADVLFASVIALWLLQRPLAGLFDGGQIRTWSTIFVSIVVQAVPFLVLGVVISGAVAAFLPARVVTRLLPRHPALAVPAAGLAGTALPGCECGSVPIAGRLVSRGAPPAAALTFLLAAPAINPVVLVSTAVAFPGRGDVVLARFLAALLTAVVMGWVWLRVGRDEDMERVRSAVSESPQRWEVFRATAVHDLLHAGGYLVVGALVAAFLHVAVPGHVLDTLGGNGITAVAAMALLAVVLCICSEADAFVAASLRQFSMTARLTFMVVGPVVDLKLVSMQAGIFGAGFTRRFAPLTLAAAVASSVLVGWWLL